MSRKEVPDIRADTGGWRNANIGQKIGVISGFVTMLVLGIMIIIWSWSPAYKILFSSLPDQQANIVLNALYSNGFDAKLDESSGAILIPANDIHYARIKLTNLGLPGERFLFQNLEKGPNNREAKLADKNLAQSHLETTQRIEEILSHRIERILEPLVGVGSVRAQVTINTIASGKMNAGVKSSDKGEMSNDRLSDETGNSNQYAGYFSTLLGDNNYISITVIVDDKQIPGENGLITRIPRTSEDLEKLTGIVKKAIGFSSQRGDSISIINTSFSAHLTPDSASKTSVFETAWHQVWFRKGIGVLLVVFLISIAAWYSIKTLIGVSPSGPYASDVNKHGNQQFLDPSEIAKRNYDENMRTASILVKEDPKLVAQVIKNWVNADGR